MATAAPLLPPGPRSSIPGRNLWLLRRDPVSFMVNLARDYGDIAYFTIGRQAFYFINHPDYIRDVLVTNHKSFQKGRALERAKRLLGEGLLTSEGEFHRRQRRLAQPAFHRQRIAGYAATMVQYSARLSDRWQPGATVDLAQEMNRLTLAIVGKTLFDADVEAEADEIGESLTVVLELFTLMNLPFLELLEKLPLPSVRRFEKARARLDATIYRMIDERRASGADRGDLLSMLLLAQDEEGDGGSMTNEQLRDELLTIFLAGHETTANALTWTWYLLSQHPDVTARLHQELADVLGGRLPTFEDVPRLRYAEMIVAEAMRLYPPAYALGRRAISDYTLGPYQVPARSIILMSQFAMHRDPRYYSEPERFDPMRWTPEARAARPKFTYFPFGGGPRQCVGEGFAWAEAILVLATLAQRWRPHLVPGHRVALQPLITLRARYGLQAVLEPR